MMIDEVRLIQHGDLVERARAGDRGAFEALLAPLTVPGSRLAVTMLRDSYEAEDAVQEASLRAWKRIGQVRAGVTSVRPWFLAIVANQCRSMRRTRWFSVLRTDNLRNTDEQRPEEELAQSEDLRRALRRLSPEDRAVLFMFYGLDLPIDEVATAMGMRPAGAKSRLYRALARLRPQLNLEEVPVP